MDWPAELVKALDLQVVDRELDSLRSERQGLLADAREARLRQTIAGWRHRLRAAEEGLAGAQRRQRLAEIERQAQDAERERANRRLYGGEVRNARDLEGLEKNIAGLSAKISELETAILEAMEQADTLRVELAAAQEGLQGAEAELRRLSAASRVRIAAIDQGLPVLEARRTRLAGRIEGAVLREYERRRQRLGGVAVADAAGARCGACGLELPALVQSRLRQAERPVACENCGRLLVEA